MSTTVVKSASHSVSTALRRYWWVVVIALASALGASTLYLLVTPPLYKASARLNIDDKAISLSSVGQTLTSTKKIGGADPVVVQSELVKSQGVISRALETYKANAEQTVETPSIKYLQSNIEVRIIPATSILELIYIGEDPEQVVQLLNAIADAAVADNTEFIRQQASTLRQFIEGQIPPAAAQLAQASRAESQYQHRYSPFPEDTEAKEFAQELSALQVEERSLLASLKETTTENQRLQTVTGVAGQDTAYTSVQAGQDPQLQILKSQITELRARITKARTLLNNQHPELVSLLEEERDLSTLYNQRLSQVSNTDSSGQVVADSPLSQELMGKYITSEVERYGVESRLKVVQGMIAQRRARAARQPLIQQPLRDLTRRREEATTRLNLLKTKLEEARLTEAQLISNIRIVGYAEKPGAPISPQSTTILVIGFFAGLVLAAGMVLLLDSLDDSIRDEAEVERLVDLPILSNLGTIPTHLINAAGLETFLDQSDLVEPYRALLKRLAPQHSNPYAEESIHALESAAILSSSSSIITETLPQVLVLSSITAIEGSSAVALCLGAVASMLGRRTLLIEADPLASVHKYLQTYSQSGLTEIIHKRELCFDYIQQTSLNQLHFLPYGQHLTRPSALVESKLMQEFLTEVKSQYDLVLIDAPSVSRSADASVWSCMTNGLVLIARPSHTPRSAILQTVEELRRYGAQLRGIALNNTVPLLEEVEANSSSSSGIVPTSQLVTR
jgi:polysaccharide biosynthesis transport protein